MPKRVLGVIGDASGPAAEDLGLTVAYSLTITVAMLVLARVVADGADAFWFGSFVEDPSQRAKVS